jgi:hypothetical protein
MKLPPISPGPWTIPTEAAHVIDFSRSDPVSYAVFHTDGPNEERRANVVACAQVPAMLEALEKAREDLRPQADKDRRTLRRYGDTESTTVAIEVVERIEAVLRAAGATDA